MNEQTTRIQEALVLLRKHAGTAWHDAALAYMRAQIAYARSQS